MCYYCLVCVHLITKMFVHTCTCMRNKKESDFAWKHFMKVHTSHWHVLVSFFGFYFVGVRCTFVIIKPVAPSQFNSGICQVPGGGHGVFQQCKCVCHLWSPRPQNGTNKNPSKEASKGWVWINIWYLLWHMVKTKRTDSRTLIICQWNLVNRFDRIKKKPSFEFFPWSECSTPCVCWCFLSSTPSDPISVSNPYLFLGNSWKVLVLQRVHVQHRRIEIAVVKS